MKRWYSFKRVLIPGFFLPSFVFLLFSAPTIHAQTPPAFYLESFAGSYAPWGMNELLVIDTLGNVSFWKSDLQAASGDSIFATLTTQQQQAIYDTISAVGFFGLNPLYDSGAIDGSGVSIYVERGGSVHSVEARNISIAAVNRIVKTLNAILGPLGIGLNYASLHH